MSASDITPRAIHDLLAPFGTLRPQSPAEWTGDLPLPPSLMRFYVEVGPYGDDGPRGPEGLEIPTTGNAFWLPALSGLWTMQAGYRWDGGSGERTANWQDAWLVVADQGGDPFILDQSTGTILHARHGKGAWRPEPMFADVFVMALVLGTIGAVHAEAGEGLYDEQYEVRPEWRTALRARLAPTLGVTEADAVATRLGW